MKKLSILLLGIMYLAFQSCVWAEVEIGGYVEMDNRVQTEGSGDYLWNRNTLGLKAEAELSAQVLGYGEIELRALGFPNVSQGSDLSEKEKTSPLELELREAYVDIYGFLVDNVDLRVGKQRVAWGTADKLNPTDNINPYDFEDLMEFGEKIPTNSLRVTGYFGDYRLETVYVPVFTPATMMAGYDASIAQGLGISPGSLESNVILPQSNMENSMYGIKLARNIFEYDMSLSYFNGRDSVPLIKKTTVTGIPPAASATVDIEYPKIQVIGYDLAGSIWDIGVWAEAACFVPEKIEIIAPPPVGISTLEASYVKYTLGFDYTFENGIYIDSQFMHGFFDERGTDLTDLVMVGIDKKYFDDKIKLGLVLGGELDFDRDNKMPGYLLGPQIFYYPADATEIELGCFIIDGEDYSKLGQMKTLDRVYLKFKYSF